MAYPSVTYTFTNGTVASGPNVSTNFSDIVAGLSDGTKDLSISALTVASTATFNGAVTLGNATGDDITVTGYLASALIPKTDDTYDFGSTSLRWKDAYIDGIGYVDTVYAADGTATDPSYSFASTGNTDNGMYLSAANEISFSTAGVQRLSLGSTGIVFVPSTLRVGTGSTRTEYISVSASRTGGSVFFARNTGTGNTDHVAYIESGSSNAACKVLWVVNGGGSPLLVAQADGNVGIGTLTPTTLLEMTGANATIRINSTGATQGNGVMFSANSSDTNKWLLYINGNDSNRLSVYDYSDSSLATYVAQGGTDWSSTSDRRLKENITEMETCLEKICAVRPVRFQWKKDNKPDYGFIAQELQLLFPEAVDGFPDAEIGPNGENAMGVAKSALIPFLIKAIQELSAKVIALEARLSA